MTKRLRSILTFGASGVALSAMTWVFFREANRVTHEDPTSDLPHFSVEYDTTASIEKLKRIGRALQLYRESVGSLPPPQRATLPDAGLPVSGLKTALTTSGYEWSVDESDFSPPQWNDPSSHDHRYQEVLTTQQVIGVSIPVLLIGLPLRAQSVMIDDPRVVSGFGIHLNLSEDELARLLKERGERVIVLADVIPEPGNSMRKSTSKVIVLRLEGQVEVLTTERFHPGEIALLQ